MSGSARQREWVAAAEAATVFEAEVLAAALRADGIETYIPNENTSTMLPPGTVAIGSGMVCILVRAGDAEAAREVLQRRAEPEEPSPEQADAEEMAEGERADMQRLAGEEEADEEELAGEAGAAASTEEARRTDADRHAAAAATTCLFTWFFPPAILATIYFLYQARAACLAEPPASRQRYMLNVWVAAVVGFGTAALSGVLYYHILVGL